MHWFLCTCDLKAVDEAISEFRSCWTNAPDPSTRNEVGIDDYSTYLHFAVNWLELDSLSALLGTDRAREILATHAFYRWINARVLCNTEQIGAVMARYGLLRRDARSI